jgi:predicted NAD/FAD-binding protein
MYRKFPRFLALHKRTVEVIKTQMAFSVSRDSGVFEWAGDSLHSMFCQLRRVFDLGMWRMLETAMRFNACTLQDASSTKKTCPLGHTYRGKAVQG